VGVESVGGESGGGEGTKIWRGGKCLLFCLRRDARATQISRFTPARRGKSEFSPHRALVYARSTLLFTSNPLIYLLLSTNPLTLDQPSYSRPTLLLLTNPLTLDQLSYSRPTLLLLTNPLTLDQPSYSRPTLLLSTNPLTLDQPSPPCSRYLNFALLRIPSTVVNILIFATSTDACPPSVVESVFALPLARGLNEPGDVLVVGVSLPRRFALVVGVTLTSPSVGRGVSNKFVKATAALRDDRRGAGEGDMIDGVDGAVFKGVWSASPVIALIQERSIVGAYMAGDAREGRSNITVRSELQ
jgi:hypothetical protein